MNLCVCIYICIYMYIYIYVYICIYKYICIWSPPQEPPKTHLTQELQLYPNTLDTVFNWLHLTQSSTGLCTPPPRTKTHLPSSSTGLCIKNDNLQCHTVYLAHLFCTAPPGTRKKSKKILYLETLWVGPHPENQKKTKKQLYLETLWGEPHPENQKRKEPWKNKKQYLETLGWTPYPQDLWNMCFLFFSGAFRVFIFSESWLDSPIPKTTYEICFCSILLFQSWYRLAFILSFATHHAHHCPTLKTQHQLQSI